jgi:hypothetical protein
MARFVYTTLADNPKDYTGLSGPVTFHRGVLLYVEGFHPTETLPPQRRDGRRRARAMAQMEYPQQTQAQTEAFELSKRDVEARGRMYTDIVNVLRNGAEISDVHDYISEHQHWPCFALAATPKELEREMAVRYAFGRCEVDFAGVNLPLGLMVICRMIPHEW